MGGALLGLPPLAFCGPSEVEHRLGDLLNSGRLERAVGQLTVPWCRHGHEVTVEEEINSTRLFARAIRSAHEANLPTRITIVRAEPCTDKLGGHAVDRMQPTAPRSDRGGRRKVDPCRLPRLQRAGPVKVQDDQPARRPREKSEPVRPVPGKGLDFGECRRLFP